MSDTERLCFRKDILDTVELLLTSNQGISVPAERTQFSVLQELTVVQICCCLLKSRGAGLGEAKGGRWEVGGARGRGEGRERRERGEERELAGKFWAGERRKRIIKSCFTVSFASQWK